MRLVVDIAPGGGAWDLAEDIITFLAEEKSLQAWMRVNRSKVEEDNPEIVVTVSDDDWTDGEVFRETWNRLGDKRLASQDLRRGGFVHAYAPLKEPEPGYPDNPATMDVTMRVVIFWAERCAEGFRVLASWEGDRKAGGVEVGRLSP